jgi:hypothetical protein
MSVANPASFNAEEADNLEDVYHSLRGQMDNRSHIHVNIANAFAD